MRNSSLDAEIHAAPAFPASAKSAGASWGLAPKNEELTAFGKSTMNFDAPASITRKHERCPHPWKISVQRRFLRPAIRT